MENIDDTGNMRPISRIEVRRSLRGFKPPIWHKDYVVKSDSSNCVYSIANNIDYNDLSVKYQSFISKFSAEIEPTSYSEAITDSRWIQAMKSEIQALEDNKT